MPQINICSQTRTNLIESHINTSIHQHIKHQYTNTPIHQYINTSIHQSTGITILFQSWTVRTAIVVICWELSTLWENARKRSNNLKPSSVSKQFRPTCFASKPSRKQCSKCSAKQDETTLWRFSPGIIAVGFATKVFKSAKKWIAGVPSSASPYPTTRRCSLKPFVLGLSCTKKDARSSLRITNICLWLSTSRLFLRSHRRLSWKNIVCREDLKCWASSLVKCT